MSDTKPCEHCGKLLALNAQYCDQCGCSTEAPAPVDAPVKAKATPEASRSLQGGILALVLVGGVGWAIFSPSEPSPPTAPPKSEAECQADVQCWSERHSAESLAPCTDAVERMAAHSFRWLDGTFDQKFTHIGLNKDEHKSIRYIGDKIEFQNGFGAFTRYSYTCTWDPVTHQATAIGEAGRLDKN